MPIIDSEQIERPFKDRAADENWRGQRVDGDKSPEAAIARRRTQFATIEEFEKWRRSKNFPELSRPDLEAAFARFRGEAPGEKAMLIPDRETRTVSAGDAGVHLGKRL